MRRWVWCVACPAGRVRVLGTLQLTPFAGPVVLVVPLTGVQGYVTQLVLQRCAALPILVACWKAWWKLGRGLFRGPGFVLGGLAR